MKKLVLILAGLALTPMVSAAGGSVHHNTIINNYESNEPGPPGPVGPPGPAGEGVPGRNGSDANINGTLRVNMGASVRWHEFDNGLSLNSGYRRDFNHRGDVVDALIVGFHFGESAADRKIRRMQRDIEAIRLLSGQAALGGAGTIQETVIRQEQGR